VLIKDCTFLELFLFEPKSGTKYSTLLIIYDCIIDLLNVNRTLLLDKKTRERKYIYRFFRDRIPIKVK